MSLSKISLPVLLFIFTCSCSIPIHYLGDSLPRTTNVKEYFDEKEITEEYRVIGTMTNGQLVNYDVKFIREEMVKKAREVGADAILYAPVEVDYDHKDGERTEVKAKLLKFQ
jgi:hypothetical protein